MNPLLLSAWTASLLIVGTACYRIGRRSVRKANRELLRAGYQLGKRYGPEMERFITDEREDLAGMSECIGRRMG